MLLLNITRRFICITLVVLTVGHAGIFGWTYAIRRTISEVNTMIIFPKG